MVSYQIFLQKITIIIVLLFVTLTLFRLGFFEVPGPWGGGGEEGGEGSLYKSESIDANVMKLED